MSHPHPLTWLYRKLGRHYPAVFITLELQSAFLIATGAVALFSFYYDGLERATSSRSSRSRSG